MILLCVVVLDLVSLGVCIWVVNWGPDTELARDLFKTCTASWQAGFGAIVGLLVAKAALVLKAALNTPHATT